MTGLIIAAGLALLCVLGLKFAARIAWRDMTAPASVLLLGLAGYAWQGSPGVAGHPVQAKSRVTFDERLAEKRRSIGERLGPASKWLIMSDGLARSGDTEKAANILIGGLRTQPDDANLWVGMGNALLAHSGGVLTPSADYAYRRAIALEPKGISPRYFLGLALAQSGQFEQGKAVWTALAQDLPPESDLRNELDRNALFLDQLVAQREAARSGGGQATP